MSGLVIPRQPAIHRLHVSISMSLVAATGIAVGLAVAVPRPSAEPEGPALSMPGADECCGRGRQKLG